MEKKNKEGLSKEFWYFFIGVFAILVVFVATGFAVFANREDEVIEKQENGGNVVLNYSSNISGLLISNAAPTTDAIGIKSLEEGNYFDFSVDVKLDNASAIEYEIIATKNKNSTISNDEIRIYLEKENSGSFTKVFGPEKFVPLKDKSDLDAPVGSMVLYKIPAPKIKSSTDNYRLRMWLSDKSLMANGSYGVEIMVKGKAK